MPKIRPTLQRWAHKADRAVGRFAQRVFPNAQHLPARALAPVGIPSPMLSSTFGDEPGGISRISDSVTTVIRVNQTVQTKGSKYQVLHPYPKREEDKVGAMSSLFMVECEESERSKLVGQRFLLKWFNKEAFPEEYWDSLLLRFGREIDIMRETASRHIVPIMDWDQDVYPSFYLMNYIGPDAGHWLDLADKFHPKVACMIISQVLSGLIAVEKSIAAHRDIKPENIFLKADCQFNKQGDLEIRNEAQIIMALQGQIPAKGIIHAALGDFGIARRPDSQLTQFSFIGTPAWAAPEAIRDSSKADYRSDIFSLGAVLFRMIVGDDPLIPEIWFYNSQTESGAADYLNANVKSKERPKNCLPLLWQTIVKAMSADPAERLSTYAKFKANLDLAAERI